MSHSRWQRHQLMRCIAPFASLAALPVVRAAGSQHLAEYPNTFYAHSLNLDRPPRPALDRHVPNVSHSALTARRRDIETDVCVVGGGFAGLAAALGLVERGKRVRPSDEYREGLAPSVFAIRRRCFVGLSGHLGAM